MNGEILLFQRCVVMAAAMQEKRIHQIFVVSVLFKGAHALIEIVGGLALYLFSTEAIARWINEVDPNDRISRYFPLSEKHFFAFYLLSHGLVKSVLVVGLLREKLWAYPETFAVLSLFIAYQLHRFYYVRDPGLIILSVLDLIVMALAWNEYRQVKRVRFAGERSRR
jgi:uncharacterized membrane protein